MLDRISLILKAKGLNSSQFADKIGAQRSSVSHIFSQRNKPSLDFIIKILKTFPDISTDWLLFGKGQMNKDIDLFSIEKNDKSKMHKEGLNEVNKDNNIIQKEIAKGINKREFEEDYENKNTEKDSKIISDKQLDKVYEKVGVNNYKSTKDTEKIVVFYKDNTFKEYIPEK